MNKGLRQLRAAMKVIKEIRCEKCGKKIFHPATGHKKTRGGKDEYYDATGFEDGPEYCQCWKDANDE